MKHEEVLLADLPDYLHEEIIASVRHSSVCFLRADGMYQPLRQCGSGTLVRYQADHGILTAAHVIRALQNFEHWFIALPSGRHMLFRKDDVHCLCTGEPDSEIEGPDIGYIRLSTHAANNVGSMFSFVDLVNHRQRLDAAGEIDLNDGVWVEVGYPEEWGSRHRDEERRIATTGIYCLSSIGSIEETHERNGFDYYDGRVTYNGGFDLPSTFAGMSGAGLWQLRLKIENGQYGIRDRFFSGVVYYEITRRGQVAKIRSHGRKSVYDYAIRYFIINHERC